MRKFQKFMAKHIDKRPIDHSYMRSKVDLQNCGCRGLNSSTTYHTPIFFLPDNLSPTQVYYADYATPQHAQDSEARHNKPLSKPEFLEAAGESGRKTNHGFHSLKLTAMSQPNFHHIQIRSRLLYSRKLVKLVIPPRTAVGLSHLDSSTDHL